jgi:hypothetical protein
VLQVERHFCFLEIKFIIIDWLLGLSIRGNGLGFGIGEESWGTLQKNEG